MFTGLVTAVGTVRQLHPGEGQLEIGVDLGPCADQAVLGASIALSGVCCTVARREGELAFFLLSEETLRRTWLGDLAPGARVNVEPSLAAGQPLGGHIVQGHVDGVGEVLEAVDPEEGGEWWVRIPRDLLRYCVVKGSIALDGVSLTIAALEDDRAMIALIPHTAQHTTIGRAEAGKPLNVEVDILAKYVERMLEARLPGAE